MEKEDIELEYLQNKQPISNKLLQRIAEDIKKNDIEVSPEEYNLQEYKIYPQHISILGDALKSNDKIKKLILRKNFITTEGAGYLAKFLKSMNLKSLDLSYNDIYYPGAMQIAKGLEESKLEEINFSHNLLGDANSAWIHFFKGNKHLKVIDFQYTEIGDNIAIALSEVLRTTNIQEVKLCHNNLTKDGVQALLPELLKTNRVSLDFSDNKINDEGVKIIVKNLVKEKKIEELDISNNQFGGKGLTWLSYLVKNDAAIKKINISGQRFDDESVINFAEAVVTNYSLEEISITFDEQWSSQAKVYIDKINAHLNNLKVYRILEKDIKKNLEDIEKNKEDESELSVLKDFLHANLKKIYKIGINLDKELLSKIKGLDLNFKLEEQAFFKINESDNKVKSSDSAKADDGMIQAMFSQIVEIQKVLGQVTSSLQNLYGDMEQVHYILRSHGESLRTGGGNHGSSASSAPGNDSSGDSGKYRNGIQVVDRPTNGYYNLYSKPKPAEVVENEQQKFVESIKKGMQKQYDDKHKK